MEKEATAKKTGISGSTLKIIAIAAMFIDHVGATLVTAYITTPGNWSDGLYNVYYVMRLVIGRIAFPIFCFLLTEGFQRTSNEWKYAFRLGIFALISEIPFDLAFEGKVWYWGYQNVFFTLLFGLLSLILMRKLEGTDFPGILKGIGKAAVLACFMVLAELLNTDYGAYGVLCIAILYLTRGSRLLQVAAGTAALWFGDAAIEFVRLSVLGIYECFRAGTLAGLPLFFQNIWKGGSITFAMDGSELMAPLGLIPVFFYNGKRGLRLKYAFYLFYPAHLLLLYFLMEILF